MFISSSSSSSSSSSPSSSWLSCISFEWVKCFTMYGFGQMGSIHYDIYIYLKMWPEITFYIELHLFHQWASMLVWMIYTFVFAWHHSIRQSQLYSYDFFWAWNKQKWTKRVTSDLWKLYLTKKASPVPTLSWLEGMSWKCCKKWFSYCSEVFD